MDAWPNENGIINWGPHKLKKGVPNQDGVYPLRISDPKSKTKGRMCQSQGTDNVIIIIVYTNGSMYCTKQQ